MQFYTVPRIIQWFVDSDRVKTELLVLFASIFLIIDGPCIFYFFVCQREIIIMLRDQLSTIVHGFKNPNCRVNCCCYGRSRSYSTMSTRLTVQMRETSTHNRKYFRAHCVIKTVRLQSIIQFVFKLYFSSRKLRA